MGTFTWDASRYYWPRDEVLRWWNKGWDWDSLSRKNCSHPEFPTFAAYYENDFAFVGLREEDAAELDGAEQHREEHKPRTERAYWGEARWLTEFPNGSGKQWTPYHLPLFDPESGALSPKHPDYEGDAKWSKRDRRALELGLKARMLAGRALEIDWRFSKSYDWRAPLAGVVLPPNTRLYFPGETAVACFDDAMIGPDSHFGSSDANLGSARFEDTTSFHRTVFGENIDFSDVIFGSVSFDGARFCGVANMSAHYRYTSFQNAIFEGPALFWNAMFVDETHFDDAQFRGGAYFIEAQFGRSSSFKNTHFLGIASFGSAQFGKVCFDDAQFGYAYFSNALIEGVARFRRAHFGVAAAFLGVKFGAEVDFEGARFLRWADFSLGSHPSDGIREGTIKSVTVEAEAQSSSLNLIFHLGPEMDWAKDASFRFANMKHVEFWWEATFENRVFSEMTDFTAAAFFGSPLFHGATLHADTILHDACFCLPPGGLPPNPTKPDPTTKSYRFKEDARKAGLSLLAAEEAYDMASADYERILSKDGESKRTAKAKAKMDAAEAACSIAGEVVVATPFATSFLYEYRSWLDKKEMIASWKKGVLKERKLPKQPKEVQEEPSARIKPMSREEVNQTADVFEAAYRRLKLLMADIGARTEEQRFFALEIQSRVKRRDGEVSRAERAFGWLYGAIAGYGRSILRPLAWLFGLSAAFTAMMGWLTVLSRYRLDPMLLLTYFAKSVPPSFMVREQAVLGSGSPEYQAWLRAVLSQHDLLFSSMATIHQVLNLILWFLFALALRRRFQIT